MADQAQQSKLAMVLAGMMSAIAAGIGVWFWQTEADFAHRFDNELAAKLQWLGIALTLIGIAGVLLAWQGGRGRDG